MYRETNLNLNIFSNTYFLLYYIQYAFKNTSMLLTNHHTYH